MSEPVLLAVGRVARAHGIRGRLLVVPYNDESQGLEKLEHLWLAGKDGVKKKVDVDRLHSERVHLGYLITLNGLDDRTKAEAYRNQEVFADRSLLPALEEGEIYAVDLVGFTVVDGAGTVRGVVEELEEAGAQDLLRLAGGTLVPLGLVREVETEARRIIIDAPEGLFELQEE